MSAEDWKNSEPTSSLADQLKSVAEYEDGDPAQLAKAIVHAEQVLTELQLLGFQRPYIYPDIDDDAVRAEWPSEWNVSLSIRPDGSMYVHACTLGPNGQMKDAEIPCGQWPMVADFIDPLLPLKLTGREGRFASLLESKQ